MARTRGNPATTTPSSDVIDKERRALELRRAGVTFDVIAMQVGYSDKAGAYKAVKRALARTLQRPAAELRQLELDRLDRLHFACWPQALTGDLKAVDRVLRIAERRARLMGLDAPAKVRVYDAQADRDVELAAAEIAKAVDEALAAHGPAPVEAITTDHTGMLL